MTCCERTSAKNKTNSSRNFILPQHKHGDDNTHLVMTGSIDFTMARQGDPSGSLETVLHGRPDDWFPVLAGQTYGGIAGDLGVTFVEGRRATSPTFNTAKEFPFDAATPPFEAAGRQDPQPRKRTRPTATSWTDRFWSYVPLTLRRQKSPAETRSQAGRQGVRDASSKVVKIPRRQTHPEAQRREKLGLLTKSEFVEYVRVTPYGGMLGPVTTAEHERLIQASERKRLE